MLQHILYMMSINTTRIKHTIIEGRSNSEFLKGMNEGKKVKIIHNQTLVKRLRERVLKL